MEAIHRPYCEKRCLIEGKPIKSTFGITDVSRPVALEAEVNGGVAVEILAALLEGAVNVDTISGSDILEQLRFLTQIRDESFVIFHTAHS